MAVRLHDGVLLTGPLAEAPVLADEDLLTARELELGTSESLDDLVLELVVGPDRDENLSNLDPGSGAMSLAAVLDKVFVAADTPSLESLRGELLQLVRHQV